MAQLPETALPQPGVASRAWSRAGSVPWGCDSRNHLKALLLESLAKGSAVGSGLKSAFVSFLARCLLDADLTPLSLQMHQDLLLPHLLLRQSIRGGLGSGGCIPSLSLSWWQLSCLITTEQGVSFWPLLSYFIRIWRDLPYRKEPVGILFFCIWRRHPNAHLLLGPKSCPEAEIPGLQESFSRLNVLWFWGDPSKLHQSVEMVGQIPCQLQPENWLGKTPVIARPLALTLRSV